MTVQVPEHNPLLEEWNSLLAESDQAVGSELITEDALDKLMKVPFVIVSVTYRDGVKRMGMDYRDDYVSCEAIVAPEPVLVQKVRMGRLKLADISVEPSERILFNDGSTGIYREITRYLHEKGIIRLPEPIVETGGKGESSFDLPRSRWETGSEAATSGIAIRLHCPRGLRFSEYENEYTADGSRAKTRYIG